jgi:hypothetical protein
MPFHQQHAAITKSKTKHSNAVGHCQPHIVAAILLLLLLHGADSNVLRDADQLASEGSVFRLYNGEYKVDVYFPAPTKQDTVPDDLVDFYLQTQVSLQCMVSGQVVKSSPSLLY